MLNFIYKYLFRLARRPIKTAPRDGSVIFIYNPKWDMAVKASWEIVDWEDHNTAVGVWQFEDETICLGEGDGSIGFQEDYELDNMPTHWWPVI